MSHHHSLLKEFVDPIRVCHPEADLSSILSIFQHQKCKMLAIPLVTGWGTITAENLLSLVIKNCYEEKIALTNYQELKERKKISRSPLHFKALLEPAIVSWDNTKLEEFLSSSEGTSWLREEKVCLIVNRHGELQGRLNRSKIIEYLAQATPARNEAVSSSAIRSSLEQISLPVKIETANGRVIYANQKWRDLIANTSAVSEGLKSASETSIDKMTQWLIEQQNYYSYLKNSHLNNFSDLSSFGIEVKQIADWNYLKIPLIQKLATSANNLQYLFLAIGVAQPEETKTKQIAVASSATCDRILTTASHELKSPLTGILGLSSLLEGQNIGSLNQRQMSYMKLIYCSGKKMMRIVDSLLLLNNLTGEKSQPTELINLEFLCRRLYQEIQTRLRLTERDCDLTWEINRSQLNIELSSETTLANKPLLSAVLSHLLLEAIESDNFQPPKIRIKSQKAVTEIEITSQKTTQTADLGLNWMIAERLSDALEAQVTYVCDLNSSKFSLLLPKNKTRLQPSVSKVTTIGQLDSPNANLTILCLYPELDVIDPHTEQSRNPNFNLKSWSDDYERQVNHQHRIIEADSLEQAHNLARIWRLDAIVLNGYQIASPDLYLRSLQEYEHLANLPLITIDARTTEAANQIEGLNVYPCLLPAQQCNIEDLVQVIRIAMET